MALLGVQRCRIWSLNPYWPLIPYQSICFLVLRVRREGSLQTCPGEKLPVGCFVGRAVETTFTDTFVLPFPPGEEENANISCNIQVPHLNATSSWNEFCLGKGFCLWVRRPVLQDGAYRKSLLLCCIAVACPASAQVKWFFLCLLVTALSCQASPGALHLSNAVSFNWLDQKLAINLFPITAFFWKENLYKCLLWIRSQSILH